MSRFDDLMKTTKKRSPGGTGPAPTSGPAADLPPGTPAGSPPPAPPAAPAPRRPGRPAGKKSDPAYEQVTAYVPRALYGSVRSVLWNHHGRKEFSELIAELLAGWLENQPSP